MEKKKSNLKSTCCNAEVKSSDFAPDFIGDDTKTMKIGTRYYICTKCNEPCDIYLKLRKTWEINPVERIVPNRKKKKSTKLTSKELKELHRNEDF